MGYRGQPASPQARSWAAGEKNLCSSAWSTSFPSFFPDPAVCREFSLTSSHSSIPLQVFFPLLNYVTTEVLPPSLMGLTLASSTSVLEPAGIGSIRHRGSFSQLLTEATSTAPPALPKPGHTNPIHLHCLFPVCVEIKFVNNPHKMKYTCNNYV